MADTPEAIQGSFDVDHDYVAYLNAECLEWAGLDQAALQSGLQAQGLDWHEMLQQRCPYLFAAAPVFISPVQLQQMQAVIAAAEAVAGATPDGAALGVFYGYDFHLNAQGAHLIEINTNAGGGWLCALLAETQHASALYGSPAIEDDALSAFVAMFRNEWRLARGAVPLGVVAIVDEQPEAQYLYPEFLLAQAVLQRAGMTVFIADPSALQAGQDGLYCQGQRVDMVYNRLTDFALQQHAALRSAWERQQVLLSPDPAHYLRHADKRRLVQLSAPDWLAEAGVPAPSVAALLQGVPQTLAVRVQDAARWWAERRQWFFKPASGYGSKGAYRGDKLTRRVFEDILQSGQYVAQRLAMPGERKVCLAGMEAQLLKYDVRCYVYAGRIQLVAARLYQGQTTNFRTPGGGFALVRVVA